MTLLKWRRSGGAGGIFSLLLGVLSAFLWAVPLPAQDECLECHKPGTKAPAVKVPEWAAHADMDCSDCHGELDIPHPKKVPRVRCGICHSDEVEALQGSAHGKALRRYLASKGKKDFASWCLSCHGKDPHALRPGKDPASPIHRKNIPATCLSCHNSREFPGVAGYEKSVHAKAVEQGNPKAAVCTDCHGTHDIKPFRELTSKVNRLEIPRTCGQCHHDQETAYKASIHWKAAKRGFEESPVCTDCHGEHLIRSPRDPRSPTWKGNTAKTCSSCHSSERLTRKFNIPADRVKTFFESYHGLSSRLGNLEAADCSSCHENHKVLPSSDPASSVNPGNLGKTCGRCHPGASRRFIKEPVHKEGAGSEARIVCLVRGFYIYLIVVVVGLMLLHNVLDLYRKFTGKISFIRRPALRPRFSVPERIQHVVLLVSFASLVVSGFALKFPDSPFAWPFLAIKGESEAFRRLVHRGAAFLFVALCLCHVLYLALWKRGRNQFRLLLPGPEDAKEAFRVVRHYLFPRGHKTFILPHYGYVEKAEYWALVWGSVVMSVTGAFLYFSDFTISHFPLWVSDLMVTIHFWEAVLATLAILVWHIYWVIFDPEIYPMNLTWLKGDPRPGGEFHAEPDRVWEEENPSSPEEDAR